MIDVTLPDGFPTDLARICQPGAKVYFSKRKEFGTVSKFIDTVDVRLDQGKASSSVTFGRDEFLSMLQSDEVVAKSRVIIPEDDNKPIRIKPRLAVASDNVSPIKPAITAPTLVRPIAEEPNKETLLTGYIDEKTGKFSKTLQPGMTEVYYKKVTKKMTLELDSVQLQKLRDMGIIDE